MIVLINLSKDFLDNHKIIMYVDHHQTGQFLSTLCKIIMFWGLKFLIKFYIKGIGSLP